MKIMKNSKNIELELFNKVANDVNDTKIKSYTYSLIINELYTDINSLTNLDKYIDEDLFAYLLHESHSPYNDIHILYSGFLRSCPFTPNLMAFLRKILKDTLVKKGETYCSKNSEYCNINYYNKKSAAPNLYRAYGQTTIKRPETLMELCHNPNCPHEFLRLAFEFAENNSYHDCSFDLKRLSKGHSNFKIAQNIINEINNTKEMNV